jgi:glycosidase
MVFQFDHVWADRGDDPWLLMPLRLTNLKAIFNRWQAGLAEVGWNSLYWNNHDQPRAVSRYGDDSPAHRVASAKMLGTVLHLHRGTPWLAANPNYPEINAEAARADPDSVYHYYRKLADLRHTEPAVVDGDFTMLLPNHEQLYAYTRRLNDTELLVIGNFSGDSVRAEVDEAWTGAELLLTNLPTPPEDWTLAPWQAVIYKRSLG